MVCKKNALTLNAYIFGHNRIVSPGHCMIKKTSIPIEWKQNIMEVNGSDDLFLWILMFSKGSIFKADSKPVYIHKNTGENLSLCFECDDAVFAEHGKIFKSDRLC